MGKIYRYVYLFTALIVFLSACNAQEPPASRETPDAFRYIDVLDKPLNNQALTDLLATNHCVHAAQFQFCKDMGLAFWLDADLTVREIYLYLNNADGFAPYQGELPLGLKFYDTLGAVDYKVRRMDPELNVEGGSPDHIHYWIHYKPYGVTVIYNSPFPDEDATIYAIVMKSHAANS